MTDHMIMVHIDLLDTPSKMANSLIKQYALVVKTVMNLERLRYKRVTDICDSYILFVFENQDDLTRFRNLIFDNPPYITTSHYNGRSENCCTETEITCSLMTPSHFKCL